jgi:hypothetical protein
MQISFLKDTFDKRPVTLNRGWPIVVQWLSTPIPAKTKKEITMWSPCSFADTSSKRVENAVSVSMLVYDIDTGMPMSYRACFEPFTYLCHTSWSHTYTTPRWRLVLPLARPIPANEYKIAYNVAVQDFARLTGYDDMVDTSCSNPNRFYYRFAINPNHRPMLEPPEVYTNEGVLYDLDYTEAMANEQARQAQVQRRVSKIKRRAVMSPNEAEIQKRLLLSTSPHARLNLAHALGATISAGVARHILCPNRANHPTGYRDRTVHYYLSPTTNKWAACNHRETCGWYGDLYQLSIDLNL